MREERGRVQKKNQNERRKSEKGQVATMGFEAANQIGWTEMRRLMTEEFCLIEEVQRMEHELWNFEVKDLT
ncbi:hypothetical protein Tco_1303964 [Tanacetum coccineum]